MTRIALLLAACLALIDLECGCKPSQRPGPEPGTGSTSTGGVSASSESASAASNPPEAGDLAPLLSELTQTVRKYGLEQRKVPRDLNELVAAGYLKAVPPAPAGKVFAINSKMEVYLANR